APVDDELGLTAARRAVSVEGTLPDLSDAVIVQLDRTATIAEGRVPWGLLPLLPPDRTGIRAASTASVSDLAGTGAGPIIVSGRSLHHLPGATRLIEELSESRDVVVLEMGTPSEWRPRKASAFVTTHGASRANSRAAAELLGVL
ncbi:MAG TPA: glycoside hydrolase family 3 protein, partial [Micromonosporaceae bacterium]